MKRFKQILKKLCCLPPLPTVLIALPSFVFVFVNLGAENKSPLPMCRMAFPLTL